MLPESIQRLPPDVVAQIKSSATIVSLNDAVYGLLKNSLDAQAAKVNITVDFARGSCTIDDNGLGILPNEFTEQGGLAKIHYSSRIPASGSTHGRHGTFLASLAAVSLLTISSRHHAHQSHNAIRLHRAEVIARHTPALPEHKFLTFSHGTRVAVRDIFGAMPVRTKQRAVDAERGNHARNFDLLKHEIVGLLLAWPHNISVTVRDAASGQSIAIRSPELGTETLDASRSASGHALKASAALTSATLVSDVFRETWVDLHASANRLSLCGAISLTPVATKRVQFISIGISPVQNEHGSNILYEEINRIFAKSSFGAESDAEDDFRRPASVPLESCADSNASARKDLKLKKCLERWPMFSLQLNFSNYGDAPEADTLNESRDALPKVLRLLRAVLHEFLSTHHLQPKPRQIEGPYRRERSLSIEPRARKSTNSDLDRRSRSNYLARRPVLVSDLTASRVDFKTPKAIRARSQTPFNMWSRSKSGVPSHLTSNAKESISAPPATMVTRKEEEPLPRHVSPLIWHDGNLLRPPFVIGPDSHVQLQNRGGTEQGEPMTSMMVDSVSWRNPATGRVSSFNPQTGLILGDVINHSPDGEGRPSTSKNRLSLPKNSQAPQPSNTWFKDLVGAWENPVFPLAELGIPTVWDQAKGRFEEPSSIARGFSELKISKAMFREATVVSQVDRKFILAKVPLSLPGTGSAFELLMVDQHAADERCKVEDLMQNYFEYNDSSSEKESSSWKAATKLLESPMHFDISQQDANRLGLVAAFFKHWGISYEIKAVQQPSKDPKKMSFTRLEVSHLPPSIMERCRLEPRLLIELLRQEAWKCDDMSQRMSYINKQTSHADGGNAKHDEKWLSRLHGCPQGILGMINSRACRTAIMFNDELSKGDCQDLLQRLSRCVFPFQCAHGRPSMVPLLEFGAPGDLSQSNAEDEVSLRKVLGKWSKS